MVLATIVCARTGPAQPPREPYATSDYVTIAEGYTSALLGGPVDGAYAGAVVKRDLPVGVDVEIKAQGDARLKGSRSRCKERKAFSRAGATDGYWITVNVIG
jgi:hypothetical protein